MKRLTTAFFLLVVFVLAVPLTGFCAPTTVAEATASLKTNFPTIEFEAVNPSPVEGVFEVISPRGILYYAPQPGLVLIGQMFSPDQRNLTQERLAQMMLERTKNLPLENALKIGNGKKTVVEFTDPDCPFCRKGSTFFKDRKDITRYVFLFPLTKLHPQAEQKARFILSSEDPVKSYHEVMEGKYDSEALPQFKDNGLLESHMKVGQKIGIQGTPAFVIKGEFIAGADLERITTLLNSME